MNGGIVIFPSAVLSTELTSEGSPLLLLQLVCSEIHLLTPLFYRAINYSGNYLQDNSIIHIGG